MDEGKERLCGWAMGSDEVKCLDSNCDLVILHFVLQNKTREDFLF